VKADSLADVNLRATILPADGTPPGRIRLAAALIVAAVCFAYHNSLGVPFLFDDVPSILENPAVRSLPAFSDSLRPGADGGLTTSGRPVVALSFLLNHAIGGYHVAGYHVVNGAIHAMAALSLFGIVRRTLLTPSLRGRFGGAALPLATTIALLWALHPLQTTAVTYVVQRAESLAALFVLLALYAFVRATEVTNGAARRWRATSVAACALAMASKESAAAAPLLVLIYDRTFVSGTFRGAWVGKRPYYVALAATWLLLLWLVVGTGGRGGTAGLGAEVSPWAYALTQCQAIIRYAGLAAWPYPLIFDYGLGTVRGLGDVLPQALLIAALIGSVIVALVRRPALGFLGAWFLLTLAPSSSFIPVVTQTMAEHRVYLPLAALVGLAVLSAHCLLGLRAGRWLGVAAVALVAGTMARNHDYRSEVAIWGDAAAKFPANARAHNNHGQALFRAGDVAGAIVGYERALALQPSYPETHYNRGVALAKLGRLPEAIAAYEAALRIDPRYPEAHNNLATALVPAGRLLEAIAHYEAAIARKPDFAEAHNNLGSALLQSGRAAEAAVRFERALALKPDYAEASYNLGNARAGAGAMAEALGHYDRALSIRPGYAEAHVNAGNALLELGRAGDAIVRYEKAIALNSRLTDAHFNLASLRLEQERWAEAAASLESVLQLDSGYVRAHRALGFALAGQGRAAEAALHYERYLRVVPDDAQARAELGRLRSAAPR
jgi:tetratricopeptide (TPR) repeat protein